MSFRFRSSCEDPRAQRLQDTLAWDLMHEYVLTDTGMHIRHVNGSFLCGAESGEGLREVTPWGGEDPCPKCVSMVPKKIRWVNPKSTKKGLMIEEACELLGVELVVTPDLPADNITGGSPSGAILDGWGKKKLYVGCDRKGKMTLAHQYGALHELTHVITAPYGFESEVACGHYAVQYALAQMLSSTTLRRRTLEMQGLKDPLFGGVLQARAWALGILNLDRSLNPERLGWA